MEIQYFIRITLVKQTKSPVEGVVNQVLNFSIREENIFKTRELAEKKYAELIDHKI